MNCSHIFTMNGKHQSVALILSGDWPGQVEMGIVAARKASLRQEAKIAATGSVEWEEVTRARTPLSFVL